MSTNSLSDFRPPIIIDIGTNSIKYSQPILNTCKLAKEVIKERNQKPNSIDPQDEVINANKIFNYKNCIETFQTSTLYNINNDDFINLDYNKKCVHYEPKPKRFQHEAIYAGRIYNFDTWETIINTIGKRELDTDYFNKEQFNETPIILMQDSLSLKELKEQVKVIYNILFEKFKAQYVMICSSGIVNLFSHNLSNGIVVDLGESKTSITPVHNGFANYNNSIHNQFLSGRTITSMMGLLDNNNANDYDIKKMNTTLTYKEYNNKLKLKHDNDENSIPFINEKQNRFGHLNYLYTFPEVFRSMFRDDMRVSHEIIEDFIYSGFNNNNKKFNMRSNIKLYENDKTQSDSNNNNYNKSANYNNIRAINKSNKGLGDQEIKAKIKLVDVNRWKEEINNIYQRNQQKEENSFSSDDDEEVIYDDKNLNYDMYLNEENYLLKKEELNKFRQFSLSHLIANQMKLEFGNDNKNWAKYGNVVFCGGVLNTPGMKQMIEEDMKSVFSKEVNLFFPDIKDCARAFYKGANYMSKLTDLENLMVSRKDYFELGEERLCYNYI